MNLGFFVTCPKGLEPLLFEELTALAIKNCKQGVAGVFCGDALEAAYRVCLWSRLANRVLLHLHQFPFEHIEQLYPEIYHMDWAKHLPLDRTFKIDFSGTSHLITHTIFGAQKVKDALVDKLRKQCNGRPSVDTENPDLRFHVRLHRDQMTVSLDLSGTSLHQRGYRLLGGAAPLKENLAAALLIRAGWPALASPTTGLIDPLCGSGTLLIEGLLMAANIAPGLTRKKWGFDAWPLHQAQEWENLKKEAEQLREKNLSRPLPLFKGYDQNPEVIAMATQNLALLGLEKRVSFEVAEIHDLKNTTSASQGLIICNPPYGERLEAAATEKLEALYQTITERSKIFFQNWELALFTGNPALCSRIGLRPRRKYRLYNGALPCQLFLYTLAPEYFV